MNQVLSMRRVAFMAGTAAIAVMVLFVALVRTDARHRPPIAVVPTATPTPPAILPITVSGQVQATVDLGAAPSTLQTALSTNIQFVDEVEPDSAQRAGAVMKLLDMWQPPLARIHFGYRGPKILPFYTPNDLDFSLLDATVAALRAHHVGYFLDVRTAPAYMIDNTGHMQDSVFPDFAKLMARIVAWYNKGGFTDDAGTFHPSGHTDWMHYWEIWNEPSSGWDIPTSAPGYNPAAAPWMRADRYANLYDTVTTAMRAVDPTIIIGGPAISSYPNNAYIETFLQNSHTQLDFLSFHFYAGYSPAEPDADVVAGVTDERFLQRLQTVRGLLDQYRPNQKVPIWITEYGFSENSVLRPDARGTGPLNYLIVAFGFIEAAYQGVALLDQFNMVSDSQLGLIDTKTLQVFRPFWLYLQLARMFPPGSPLLPLPISSGSHLVGLATIATDGKSLHLLVVNTLVTDPNAVKGQGMPTTPTNFVLTLKNTYGGKAVDPTKLAASWHFDADSPVASMPAPRGFALGTVNGTLAVADSVGGYGATIISVPLK